MADCTIIKRPSPEELIYGPGRVRAVRRWLAVCSRCDDLVRREPRSWMSNPPPPETFKTRKQAKDGLYHHQQKHS
jgi:hypothetical protein